MTTIERLRALLDNAVGGDLLPPAWAELVRSLPALLDVVEAAQFDHSAHRLVDCRGCAALDRLEGAL